MNEKTANLSEFIREAFGSNATYVEGLLDRYKTDPKLVDESWQAYFGDLLNGGAPSLDQEAITRAVTSVPAAEKVTEESKKISTTPLPPDTESKPITGVAKKIVENMEQSLTVPTATSFRTIPVKVLEENRRIINEHLASQGRGKVSFTHVIAWAIGFHGRGLSGLWQDGKRRGGSLMACEGNPAGLQGSTATARGIWCGGRGGP